MSQAHPELRRVQSAVLFSHALTSTGSPSAGLPVLESVAWTPSRGGGGESGEEASCKLTTESGALTSRHTLTSTQFIYDISKTVYMAIIVHSVPMTVR